MARKKKLLSQRAYAKHRGVTLRAVQKALQAGRIHLTAGGKIDADAADRQWNENTKQRPQAKNQRPDTPARTSKPRRKSSVAEAAAASAAKPAQPSPTKTKAIQEQDPEAPANGTLQESLQFATLTDAQKAHETLKAELARLKFERESGKLVEREKVEKELFRNNRIIRDAVLNIPDRIAGAIAAEFAQWVEENRDKSPMEALKQFTMPQMHQLAMKEVRKALEHAHSQLRGDAEPDSEPGPDSGTA